MTACEARHVLYCIKRMALQGNVSALKLWFTLAAKETGR